MYLNPIHFPRWWFRFVVSLYCCLQFPIFLSAYFSAILLLLSSGLLLEGGPDYKLCVFIFRFTLRQWFRVVEMLYCRCSHFDLFLVLNFESFSVFACISVLFMRPRVHYAVVLFWKGGLLFSTCFPSKTGCMVDTLRLLIFLESVFCFISPFQVNLLPNIPILRSVLLVWFLFRTKNPFGLACFIKIGYNNRSIIAASGMTWSWERTEQFEVNYMFHNSNILKFRKSLLVFIVLRAINLMNSFHQCFFSPKYFTKTLFPRFVQRSVSVFTRRIFLSFLVYSSSCSVVPLIFQCS